MFKKIALAAALAATASFATWDYYPVLEANKGTAEAGLYYDWDHDWSQAGLRVGARYSVIQSLEVSLQGWGYRFWSETDCGGCPNGGDGLNDLTVGFRYQIDPMVNAFLDLHLPIGSDDDGINGHPVSNDEVSIYLGGQFSMPTNVPGFVFGTEAGLDWGFEHHHRERGLEIHLAGEAAYSIPEAQGLTPYIGLQMKLQLTEDTWEDDHGNEVGGNDDGDSQINLWLGASFPVAPMLSVKGQLNIRSGDMDGNATGFYVAADFNF